MKKRANKTGFRGVYKNNTSGWQAQICVGPRPDKKKISLGTFETKEEAAHAYDDAALEHHGDRAVLNFPRAKRRANREGARRVPFESAPDFWTRNQDVIADEPVRVPVVTANGSVINDALITAAEMPVSEPEPVPTAVPERAKVIPAGGDVAACPKCASTLFVEITQGIRRCQQCGHQERVEPNRVVVPPVVVKLPRAATPSECPACGSSLLQAVGGGGLRCQACGNQTNVEHSNGLSRKDLESYDGKPAHAQMQAPASAFFQALARMRGFGR
jgi:DNA-directed RNA polymerase subunit M/transcription elongation factor TFIIS